METDLFDSMTSGNIRFITAVKSHNRFSWPSRLKFFNHIDPLFATEVMWIIVSVRPNMCKRKHHQLGLRLRRTVLYTVSPTKKSSRIKQNSRFLRSFGRGREAVDAEIHCLGTWPRTDLLPLSAIHSSTQTSSTRTSLIPFHHEITARINFLYQHPCALRVGFSGGVSS
jgi:hypothetical protein